MRKTLPLHFPKTKNTCWRKKKFEKTRALITLPLLKKKYIKLPSLRAHAQLAAGTSQWERKDRTHGFLRISRKTRVCCHYRAKQLIVVYKLILNLICPKKEQKINKKQCKKIKIIVLSNERNIYANFFKRKKQVSTFV